MFFFINFGSLKGCTLLLILLKGEFGTIDATWGSGNRDTDWNLAAEEAAKRIQKSNPDMLIIVGGTNFNVFLWPAYNAPITIKDQVILDKKL